MEIQLDLKMVDLKNDQYFQHLLLILLIKCHLQFHMVLLKENQILY